MHRLAEKQVVDALEAEIAEVCGVVNAAQGRLVELVGRVVETGAWEGAGIRSVEQWVAWKCAVTPSKAKALVAMAARIGELPVTHARFRAGELSADQVAVVTRHAPESTDAEVAELAGEATVDQLSRTLSRYLFARPVGGKEAFPGEDPEAEPAAAAAAAAAAGEPAGEADPVLPVGDGSARPAEVPIERRVSFGFDDDGSWRLWARLGPDEGAMVEAAFTAARDALFAAEDHAEGVKPSPRDNSWADAFVAMADRSMSPGAACREGRDRHLVLVHLRAEDLAARLHLGPPLPDSLRRQFGCDGRIRPVFSRNGVALSVGRTQRIVPDRTRILVEDRDGGCRVPGCQRRRWLQVHHITHWEDGGATDTANLLALCSSHHRLHHQGRLGIGGDADDPAGMSFTDELGRPMAVCGKPVAPESIAAGVAGLGLAVSTWRHPSGERLDPNCVYFSEPVGAG